MQPFKYLSVAISTALLAACSSSSNSPNVGTLPPTNSNGSTVTGVITAQFDTTKGFLPFPNNLLFAGSIDGTLSPPVANEFNTGDPAVALSALDGFSTVAPWSTTFSAEIDPATIVAGQTVRFFEVTRPSPSSLGVTAVVRELMPNVDYVAAVSPSTEISAQPENNGKRGIRLAVIPTKPLEASSLVVSGTTAVPNIKTYMVVLTKGIKDRAGNDATPDTTYFIAKRTSTLINGVCPTTVPPNPGNFPTSTDPLLPVATACGLEPVRQLVNAQEALAATQGIPRADIILSWTASTQYISPTLGRLRAAATPSPSTIVKTPLNTGAIGLGLPATADIYIGVTPVNYYLTAPGVVPEGSAAGTAVSPPTAVLTGFWRANATVGGTTNLTFQNSVPARNSVQAVPVLMTVPNAIPKPATGWPVVIYNHGITRNRTDMLAISTTYASIGYAVIAIDQPLHGVDRTSPFYIEGTPFAAASIERTFDVDLVNNTTGATGPDGVVDASGTHFINLGSLLTSRDNNRQAQSDLVQLVKNISTMSIDGDATPDFDTAKIAYTGQSLGSINLIPAMAVETSVNVGVLSVPGGGIAQLLNGSQTFGPRIRAGLAAAAGLQPGTSSFDQYLTITQTVIDSADPINWARALTATDRVLLQEVVGTVAATDPSCALTNAQGQPIAGAPANGCPDAVIPNRVTGSPLSGTEPLIATMGLSTITATTQSATGIKGAVRFIKGDHGSLLSPAKDGATTVEMQSQMASMVASGGAAVQVTNATVVKPN